MMKRFMLAALVLAAGSMTLFAADKPAKPQAAQDVQVAVEMKTVCVSESFFERMGVDFMMKAAPKVIRAKGCDGVERIGIDFCKPCDAACPKDGKCDPTKVMFLNDCQLHMLMEAVQGDRHANVMSAPKITTMNGQTACICVGDQQAYVTGVKVETVNGQVVMVPENKTFETGIKLDLLPTVSADRKFVSLQLKGRFTEMNGEAKLHPVTAMVNPVFEGGLTGVPVPFTQFIQQPSFQTVA